MFGSLSSIFGIIKFKKSGTKDSKYVVRDELDVKHKGGFGKRTPKPSYYNPKDVRMHGNKNTTRVKVLMTKEEARLLLSKCDDGGALNFKNVTTNLTQIPVGRVSIVSLDSSNGDAMLESIPEEE